MGDTLSRFLNLSNPVQAVKNVVSLKNDILSGQPLFGPNGAIPKSLRADPLTGSAFEPVNIPGEAPIDPSKAPDPNANAELSGQQQLARANVGNRQGQASTLLSGSNGQSTQGLGGARTLLGY